MLFRHKRFFIKKNVMSEERNILSIGLSLIHFHTSLYIIILYIHTNRDISENKRENPRM